MEKLILAQIEWSRTTTTGATIGKTNIEDEQLFWLSP